jgi:hypothetical protein
VSGVKAQAQRAFNALFGVADALLRRGSATVQVSPTPIVLLLAFQTVNMGITVQSITCGETFHIVGRTL